MATDEDPSPSLSEPCSLRAGDTANAARRASRRYLLAHADARLCLSALAAHSLAQRLARTAALSSSSGGGGGGGTSGSVGGGSGGSSGGGGAPRCQRSSSARRASLVVPDVSDAGDTPWEHADEDSDGEEAAPGTRAG